eukprot:SAG11_NODE_32674_length_281_cov_1.972527_1_plen_58_part_10
MLYCKQELHLHTQTVTHSDCHTLFFSIKERVYYENRNTTGKAESRKCVVGESATNFPM